VASAGYGGRIVGMVLVGVRPQPALNWSVKAHTTVTRVDIHSAAGAVSILLLQYFPPPCINLLPCSTVVVRSTPLNAPVKDIVVLVALLNKEVAEEFTKVGVVWLIIEMKRSSIVQKDAKLVGETMAKKDRRSSHPVLHDSIVLLLFGGSLQALPRESTMKEIHENVSKTFKIVPTSLFNSKMRIN
jgi:hypothetical protein